MKTKPASKRGQVAAALNRQQRCLLTEVCPHKLKQILVPIDFSDCSRKALRNAVPVAERFSAQLLLLYVIETNVLPAELGFVPSEVKRAGIASAQTALEELAQRTERALGTHFVRQTTVRNGIPWQEITAAAQALDVDLIVPSTHGYTGIKHILVGSTAKRVVQHAPCPVLVVREREHEFPTNRLRPCREESLTSMTLFLHRVLHICVIVAAAFQRVWESIERLFRSKEEVAQRAMGRFEALQRTELEVERLDSLRNPSGVATSLVP